MRRWIISLIVVATAIIVMLIYGWPAIEEELMREPFISACSAVRGNDAAGLRESFTSDAEFSDGANITVPASKAIDVWDEFIKAGQFNIPAPTVELMNIEPAGKGLTAADIRLIFRIEGANVPDDMPYRYIRVKKSGQALLKRTGWWTWKVQSLLADDIDFRALLGDPGKVQGITGN